MKKLLVIWKKGKSIHMEKVNQKIQFQENT